MNGVDVNGGATTAPRFHGRRHGRKLRPGRNDLLHSLLPRIRLVVDDCPTPIDPSLLFAHSVTDVWLEIGFGAGEHLAQRAAESPEVGFIGCEPYVSGVASLLSRLSSENGTNVRIFDDDARLLLPRLAEASIGRVFLLFPDPWPKKRHWQRRFLTQSELDNLAGVLADGGDFWFATDHMGYAGWALQHAIRHPAFTWLARRPDDWRRPPNGWIQTRYESKALAKGDYCTYLRFRRRNRQENGS